MSDQELKRVDVRCSPIAQEQLVNLKELSQGEGGFNGIRWSSVLATVQDFLSFPERCLIDTYVLKSNLLGVYRKKLARLRLFYIGTPERVIILFVGYRKGGDKSDAYEDFARPLARGDFNAHFAELGLALPPGVAGAS